MIVSLSSFSLAGQSRPCTGANLEGMLADMKAKGVKLINETPTIGVGGKQIAFIHPSSANGVLVELYQNA